MKLGQNIKTIFRKAGIKAAYKQGGHCYPQQGSMIQSKNT